MPTRRIPRAYPACVQLVLLERGTDTTMRVKPRVLHGCVGSKKGTSWPGAITEGFIWCSARDQYCLRGQPTLVNSAFVFWILKLRGVVISGSSDGACVINGGSGPERVNWCLGTLECG